MAQLVAHLLCKQGVRGSSPLGSTGSHRSEVGVAPGHIDRDNPWNRVCWWTFERSDGLLGSASPS